MLVLPEHDIQKRAWEISVLELLAANDSNNSPEGCIECNIMARNARHFYSNFVQFTYHVLMNHLHISRQQKFYSLHKQIQTDLDVSSKGPSLGI